jgi:hypothetical protein
MYGDNDYNTTRRDSRPLSFISSPNGETFDTTPSFSRPTPQRSQLSKISSNEDTPQITNKPPKTTSPTSPPGRENGSLSPNGPLSPPSLHRSNSDVAQQHFPLGDTEYESNPAAVARELSNLQAIRRMSMDVNASDPDLPSFSSGFSIPTVAPSHSSDQDDPSKLFWVPARLHPELAPKAFKDYAADTMQKIRRRSGGEESLSPDGLGRSGSGGGLRRKKSMLSRRIEDGDGYRDGAERLERKKSGTDRPVNGGLADIEENAEGTTDIIKRLSLDAIRKSVDSGSEPTSNEDMPILPAQPGGHTLKRSTRTNYRRGSLRKGERLPFSRRAQQAQQHAADTDTDTSPATSPTLATHPEIPKLGLSRVQTEPVLARSGSMENFSRPTRKRTPPITTSMEPSLQEPNSAPPVEPHQQRSPPQPRQFHSRIASNGRTTAQLPGVVPAQQVPQIIETPPPTEPARSTPKYFQPPERSSSHQPPPAQTITQPPPPRGALPGRPPSAGGRIQSGPPPGRQTPSPRPDQTLDDLVSHPTPLPGNQSTRTDVLSTIPFEDKKVEKKSRDKKEESEGKKSSWWFLGKDSKKEEEEREREKERREREEREHSKKLNKKSAKVGEKPHDNARLDLLQTAMDSGRPRESLVLDRESIKLDEERKKESSRKSGNDAKKEKDGIFSSLFGGSKKKAEKEASSKRGSSSRGLSPEPPPRILKPDIDYNWTRFSILEERAIYRMAHIKLANPRRELYSQVLLSNFMYSYLAKVQQMHPHIQIAQSPAQKKLQNQQQQQQQQLQLQQKKEQDQPEEFIQYQKYQQVNSLSSFPSAPS